MENGVGNVDGSYLGERRDLKDEVLESRVEERAACGSDSEGDEVFEMAMETEIPIVDSEDVILNEDGNVEEVGNSASSLGVDEGSNVENEAENFEEAVGLPNETAMVEVIDEQIVIEKGLVDESNGLGNDELVANEENGGNEVADVGCIDDIEISQDGDVVDENSGVVLEKSEKGISVDGNLKRELVHDNSESGDTNNELADVGGIGDTEISQDGDVVDENSGVVLEKSEKGISVNENLERELVQDNSHSGDTNVEVAHAHVEPENGDVNKVGAGNCNSHLKVESNGEILHQAEYREEVNETVSNLDTVHQDDKSEELEDTSAGFRSKQLDDKVQDLKDNLVHFNMEPKDDSYEEPKEEASANLGPGHLYLKSEEPKDTLSNLDMENQDDASSTRRDNSASINSEHHVESHKQEDNLRASVEERTVTLETGSLPSLEDSVADNREKIQPSVSDSGAENCKASQTQRADETVEASSAESKDSGKRGGEDEVVKHVIQDNRDRDIKSEADISSSSVKSTNPAPVPARPADLGHAVPPTNPAPVPARPADLGHAVPPTNPAPVPARPAGLGRAAPPTNPAPVPAGLGRAAPPTNPARPAGLGRAAPLLEPAPRVVQQTRVNGTAAQMQNQLIEDPTNGETEENDETREKLQMIRVKFLRLAHRLGQTPHNVVVAQVLYRLGLAEQLRGRNGGRVAAFSFDRASAMAEQLEAAGQEPLDFSCTIMVLGKTGVGKSATINSIFDEVKFGTDAFQSGTKKVQDVVGTVQGIEVRVIDTPGLLPSWSDQRQNEKILHSVKRFIKKTPPDIVLYLDRLDMQSRDFCDMPLLRTITDIFGPSIWFNAIVVLTHAASAPPEGPNGTATSYDMFVTQRSHVVQQAIRQAAGDMRLMNPVSLVENHSACRTNRAGQRVLPNGQVWKPHLLLLSFASKILAEANTLLKLQDSPPGKPFTTRTRAPPLPFLLSSLLQSRPQLKLPEEQFADDDNLDDDLDESSDSDSESEYDELPPFKRLTKAQLAKLTKVQRKAYYDELEYREKLFMKKQLKEEKKRRKMMKEMAASVKDLPSDYRENLEEESGGAASVPVPMPDLPLPASFDSENPTHRYRYLDSSNQWLVRPDLEPHGWDHDVGYDGISVERLFVVKDKLPVSFSGQVTKDKKDANLHMELASSVKHGKGKATSLGIDMQTVGKEIAYTLRSETRFSNYRQNKATAGISATVLGDALTAGVKVEDKLIVKKRLHVVMSGGAVAGRGDVAYGGSLEATLRDKDHPLGRSLSTFGLSIMDWHGDLAIGWNFQSQIPVGRFTNLIGRVNVNNRGSGQVSIRLNSSEQLQIALIGLIPLLRKVLGYPQELQFGQR